MTDPRLLLAFYGDDFSGSTDAMESLALEGIRTILFLQAPTSDTLRRYEGVRAVGLAGVSRSMNLEQMDTELTAAFESLKQLGAPLIHYKVCSTFDSSPQIGSIGRAIEIGIRKYSSRIVPVIVGAPVLGRFCAFGNLFARSGLDSPVYRLDRHPTMSRHPTTPMDESDLRVVLGRQTRIPIHLIDTVTIDQGPEAVRQSLDRIEDGIVLFDTINDNQLATIGQTIWGQGTATLVPRQSSFVTGSSGVEYALRAYWRRSNLLPSTDTSTHRAARVPQIVCASGSCSPVTSRQITHACQHGFAELAADPMPLIDPSKRNRAIEDLVHRTAALLKSGQSVVVHTSHGPDDDRIRQVRATLGEDPNRSTAAVLGSALGEVLRATILKSGISRVAVTGGDTSGYVARQLGIEALEFVAPVAPGSPLCRVHARANDTTCAGLEIAFKGGQVGHADYLVRVRDGYP